MSGADRSPELRQEQLDRLRSLPYRAYSSRRGDPDRSGVVLIDRERSWPGFNLYVVRNRCRAELIDQEGRLVHSWDGRRRGFCFWSNVELQDNGDLLVVAQYGWSPMLLRLGWNGELRWQSREVGYHDVDPTPQGTLLTLSESWSRMSDSEQSIVDNELVLLSSGGERLESISLLATMRAAGFPLQKISATRKRRRETGLDPLHCNSVEWMVQPHLRARGELYAADNVLVCCRHQDMVLVFDWKRKELVWWWGQGELSGPHDASCLPNGNLLIFDNGLNRGWSRVLEVDPLRRRIEWVYQDENPKDFFSPSRGSCQRLPNGNTLIANSDSGEAFEVTREGRVVWRFYTPHRGPKGHRVTIVRIKRYPVDPIEKLLASHSAEAS